MAWIVNIHRKAERQVASLPLHVSEKLVLLLADLADKGPVRGEWPNYGKLPGGKHHCHLKNGKPTYVAVWNEEKETVTVEIVYVGTHEKAPY